MLITLAKPSSPGERLTARSAHGRCITSASLSPLDPLRYAMLAVQAVNA